MFPRVKGVTDNFFEMTYYSGIRKKIEGHLKRYNFFEIDIPMIEYVSLFERGLGYETDVVSKQMFIIQKKQHDSDNEKDLMCLRPEGTAGTMRAFLEQQEHLPEPCRVFSYGSMFRYERPQKGRLREFHQMNLETLGCSSVLYDAHMIKMLQVLFVEVLGIQDCILKINFLGQSEDRKKYCASLVSSLTPYQEKLCSLCQNRLTTNPLRILDCKSQDCQKICLIAPKLTTFFSETTQQEWKLLQETLEELSVTFMVDDHLVRGLDYYNKTVFEFVSANLGAQNTFCGGGRYDGLAQQLGSKTVVPALGCAIGMERLALILESSKDRLLVQSMPLLCIIPLSEQQNKLALHLADFLIAHGKCVELLLDHQKIKNKMKRASDLKAAYVLILGEDEQNNNTVTVKDMVTGKQEVILQTEVHTKI